MMTAIGDSHPITLESRLNDVLARCPSAGQILVQAGKGYVNRRGDLYAQFPDLTVAQYAELNGLDANAVVARLSAAVEAEEMARKARPPARAAREDVREDAASVRRTPLAIGYTSSYHERQGEGPGSVPFTVVYSERGPE
jgi:hypothetical protein